ncbi:MAG TPA: hypothetical protein VE197_11170, partial [Mycobacterium sp.]|nr:hypothetical protein [Mycobacterium sp.]
FHGRVPDRGHHYAGDDTVGPFVGRQGHQPGAARPASARQVRQIACAASPARFVRLPRRQTVAADGFVEPASVVAASRFRQAGCGGQVGEQSGQWMHAHECDLR